MLRLSTIALPGIAAALAASSAAAQTVEVTGQNTVVDQLTPPGGRCVPTFANTVSYGPGDIRSDGTTNLGTFTETVSHCVTSLPPTDIIDGQSTITLRGGDTITGVFSGRADSTATPGTFAATRTLTVTGGTGRFTGASGTISGQGLLSVAAGVGNYTGTLTGSITTTATIENGNFATAYGDGSAAIGAYASAFGGLSIANGERTTAIGSQAEAIAGGATAVGDQTIASGLAATALGQLAEATAPAATALGHNADALGLASTAVGVRAAATATASTAVGRFASATFAGSTALGSGATTTAANQVALGGTGSAVRVGDIAASTAAQSGAIGVATVDGNGVLGRNTTVLTDIAALQTASSGFQSSIGALNGQVSTLFDLREFDRRDFRKGIAAAVAMGSAPFPSAPGKTSYVLNGSVFRGEPAVGGSLMHRIDSDTPFAIGVGFSLAGKKNNAFRAGVAGEF